MIKHSASWHSQNSLFKHFQGYLGTLRNTNAYSATLKSAQLGRRGEASPNLFENWEKCPEFGKKALTVSIIGLNVPFKMQFSKYLGEKTPKCFPVGPLFLVFLTKCLVPQHPPSSSYCPETFLVAQLQSSIILFCKTLHRKCLTVFWICLFQ